MTNFFLFWTITQYSFIYYNQYLLLLFTFLDFILIFFNTLSLPNRLSVNLFAGSLIINIITIGYPLSSLPIQKRKKWREVSQLKGYLSWVQTARGRSGSILSSSGIKGKSTRGLVREDGIITLPQRRNNLIYFDCYPFLTLELFSSRPRGASFTINK